MAGVVDDADDDVMMMMISVKMTISSQIMNFQRKPCVFICEMHMRCTASRRERRKIVKLRESVVFSYVKCTWDAPRLDESVAGGPKCCK